MIKFENTEVFGWEAAIRGMRNPMNSHHLSDSYFEFGQVLCDDCPYTDRDICGQKCLSIGHNDHKLMMSLAKGGPVHAKYRRMINVYVDITAPLYWWKEFDTYKVGTVANSCSTMHKIHAKEFTLDDFSHEHLMNFDDPDPALTLDDYPVVGMQRFDSREILDVTIEALNFYRNKYLETKTKPMKEESKRAGLMKKYWWQMIQLLPSSYNQKRTVMLNYEVLHNIYISRQHHKLDEWSVDFINWIKSLPYSEIIAGEVEED